MSLQDLDDVILKWGDVCCHGPVLLAWMAFKFIAQPRTELEVSGMVWTLLVFRGTCLIGIPACEVARQQGSPD